MDTTKPLAAVGSSEGLGGTRLPQEVTLHHLPDGRLSSQYRLTLGRSYAVRGEMGSCVVIDTDEPGETASIHWSRFVPPNAEVSGLDGAAG